MALEGKKIDADERIQLEEGEERRKEREEKQKGRVKERVNRDRSEMEKFWMMMEAMKDMKMLVSYFFRRFRRIGTCNSL